jgi:large subunit ribosomal protein L11
MAKKIKKVIKVQAKGGAATPAPPLGPVLGQAGINIGEFISQFNGGTQDRRGEIVPCVITVYEDRSFSLQFKSYYCYFLRFFVLFFIDFNAFSAIFASSFP